MVQAKQIGLKKSDPRAGECWPDNTAGPPIHPQLPSVYPGGQRNND